MKWTLMAKLRILFQFQTIFSWDLFIQSLHLQKKKKPQKTKPLLILLDLYNSSQTLLKHFLNQ